MLAANFFVHFWTLRALYATRTIEKGLLHQRLNVSENRDPFADTLPVYHQDVWTLLQEMLLLAWLGNRPLLEQ